MLEMSDRMIQGFDKETSSEFSQTLGHKTLAAGVSLALERSSFLHEEGGPKGGAVGLFLWTFWFGLLAGWLELGLVRTQRVVNPHLPMDALRINRHFVWMIPVSEVLIFVVVGVLIAAAGGGFSGALRTGWCGGSRWGSSL